MKKIYFTVLAIGLGIFTQSGALAQDDLMSLLDEETPQEEEKKVSSTFKTLRIINAQTIETIKAKSLMFSILHRFGNVSGGGHAFYGFDNASNIRFGFDYGVTDKLIIGVGRSKVKEHIDGNLKYKLLAQTKDNKVPVSIAWYSNAGFTPMISPKNSSDEDKWTKPAHRFSYAHQLIIARKFSPAFSFQLLPTLVHRNYVTSTVNETNGAEEENDLAAIGFAGRLKFTKRISLVADYFYVFSKFRENNLDFPFYAPLGIGIEIETGGHVFHANFTNSSGLIENDYLPATSDSWLDGDIKLGFNISRVFYL